MNLLHVFLGEMLGTMMLILLGNGVVANVLYKKTKGTAAGPLTIFVGWGFAVMVGVITAQSFSDGNGHLNPAVTLFFLTKGSLTVPTFFTFIGSQILGATLGQIIVNTVYWNFANQIENKDVVLSTHSTGPVDQRKWFNNFFAEFVGTIVLMAVVAASLTAPFTTGTSFVANLMLKAFIVGMVVLAIGASLGGVTGYAINPFRDLIPRLVYQITPFKNKQSANWSYSWVPVVAPATAGVIAGAFARLIVA